MSAEEWREAPGTDGRYEVSSLGRIRCVGRPPRVGSINRRGYRHFQMRVGGRKAVNLSVHRLICEAFHGAPFEGAVVRHLDGDTLNNLPENLAWGTVAENIADQTRHGTKPRGERHANAKLTESGVREIRRRRSAGERAKDLAREFGISDSMIAGLCRGERWAGVAL